MTITTTYQGIVQFSRDQFNPIIVAESARTRVILACFEPGQFIPVHTPGVDLTLTVLEGDGTLVASDQENDITSGTLAFIPAGEARGITASTRLITLFTVTPPPTEADHQEVVAGLKSER